MKRSRKKHHYLIIIEKAGRNYSAYSPDIDGCISTGKTPEEAKKNFNMALELHIKGLLEDKCHIPKPSTRYGFAAIN